jgi:hypothetical protein
MVTPKGSMSTEGETLEVSVLLYKCWICPLLVTYRAPDKRFSHTLDSLGQARSAQAAILLNFMYHSRIFLSVGSSAWYMVRNPHRTVTIDSILANSKTQNAFLFPFHAMFLHDCPLAVKPANTPRRLVQKNLERFSTY